MLRPFDPLPAVLRSVKVKWAPHVYGPERFHHQRLSKLYDSAGTCFVMSQTKKAGGSGKIRWAINLQACAADGAPQALAIKELRHQPRRYYPSAGIRKTTVVPRRDAIREAKLTRLLREVLDGATAPWDLLPPTHPQSLQKARTHTQPFKLHACVATPAKTYIVMNRDAGALAGLLPRLDGPLKAYAAASAWAQITSELQALHDQALYVHLDVSPGNIFYTTTGQFKLMDFGKAERLEKITYRRQGVVSTLVPPEAVRGITEQQDLMMLDGAADVFCAAATVVGTFARPATQNLFAHLNMLPGHTQCTSSFYELYAQMERWYAAIRRGPADRITAADIIDGQDGLFKEFFEPLARAHPALCELMINDAMALDPYARLPAALLAQDARQLLPEDGLQRDRLVEAIGALGKSKHMTQFHRHALLYDAWDRQMSSRALNPATPPRAGHESDSEPLTL